MGDYFHVAFFVLFRGGCSGRRRVAKAGMWLSFLHTYSVYVHAEGTHGLMHLDTPLTYVAKSIIRVLSRSNTLYAIVRNAHTTPIAPHPVCSVKLSGVGQG